MNFIEDVLERFPAARPALVTISGDGERRVWGFGELIARSAGLAGALAARGAGRGDVVMTLVGNRVEWVLTMLACWRMGAIALPCNTQLRRGDLEVRVAAAKPALTSSPTGIATLKPAWSCSKRTPCVPKACSPMKPPVAMNAKDSSRTRASPRRFADSPAAYPRTNAKPPTNPKRTK